MEQKKLKMNNQKFCRILSFVVALLIIINVALMIASNMLASTLDTYLGKGHLVKESPNGTESWDTSYYDVKYQNNKESTEAAYEVAAQVMQEGTVLLKNNGILPLADGSTVTPFGRAYLDPIYGQLTSGGSAKWVVDPVSPEQALSSVYTLNNAAVDKMKASPDPKALTEAEGTFSAGESGLLGGNSFLYEYAPSIYDGMDDVSGTTGIVFITRAGQEGSDKKYDAYTDGTPHYLALSSNEKEAIKIAKEKCGSVIVVLVSSAPMELTPIQSGEYEADAILWVGHPGERGFAELAGIMDGSTVPSGRTVDIYPSDFTKDPSYQNIGSFSYDNAPVMIEGVFSSGNAGFCCRYAIRIPFCVITCPSSGCSSPASTRKSVVFPVPLIPITPIFSPSEMPQETSSKITFPPKILLICSILIIFIKCRLLVSVFYTIILKQKMHCNKKL